VRRADAAEKTATEVDRLLTATPANADSDWMAKTGPAKDEASKQVKDLKAQPMYMESKARVVPSEVWSRTLPTVQNADGKYPNILAAINRDLSDKYAKVMQKKKQLADVKAQIATEDAALDQKDLKDEDKQMHKDKIAKLNEQADKAEDAIDPVQKEFLESVKASSAKAPADVRDKFGIAIVNLRQAVEDAEIANGAAAVRYPMAAPSLLSSVKSMVPVFIADIVEEKTGKRPTTNGLKPDVKLDGTKVNITLNGISDSDLSGKLTIGDLTTETLKRTQRWVGHALGLLGSVAANKEVLSFEEKTLDGVIDGFTSAGWKAQPAATIVVADPSAHK
jgi:hypothetical protein